jgi:hypothetical protein
MSELIPERDDRRVYRRIMTEARGRALWRLNVAVYGGIYVWILADGRFPQTALTLRNVLKAAFAWELPAVDSPQLTWRLLPLAAAAICAVGSLAGVFAALFVGAARHRRLRSWLTFTLLAATWLSLGVSWREVAWRGQQWRVWAHLSQFSPLAASLSTDWPNEDGERADLGAFMAYPRGRPSVLLTLTPPTTSQEGIPFSAVERSDDGALRFELADNETGSWLEWHSPGKTPESFVGGLLGHYSLDRCAELGGGWFLVRYCL